MGFGESDTRAKLIDPAIHACGWTEDLIKREETAGTIEIIQGKPRKQAKGRVDYTLRIKVNPNTQPIAVALPRWMYFKKVGLEILKYSIAWSVVRTESVPINDIEFLSFSVNFINLRAKNMPREGLIELIA